MTWLLIPWSQVPSVSSDALRRADTEARDRFGIEPLQLMEVAGWQVARFVDGFIGGIRGKRVTVVAGSGNNGGDALVAARFVHQRGAVVRVSIVPPRDATSLAAHHLKTIRELGIREDIAPLGIDRTADVIIDGLLGTGIRPPLRDPAPAVIAAINASAVPVIAIDVPSGLDADTAAGGEDAVMAAVTLTLAAPKRGLASTRAAGRVFLADIGMPAGLFGSSGEALAALFAMADLVELVDRQTDSS